MRQIYSRGDLKKTPEQFLFKLNKDNLFNNSGTISMDSPDKKYRLVIGLQPPPSPPNTFGVRRYVRNGDQLTLEITLI